MSTQWWINSEIKYQLATAERALEKAYAEAADEKLREKIDYAITALADAWAYL